MNPEVIRLPDEFEDNILLRLPVKSLLRFRCVSKRWCALFDTNGFVKQHINHHSETNEYASLVFNVSTKLYSVRVYNISWGAQIHTPLELDQPVMNFLYNGYRSVVVGACNSLICLKYDKIIIWNLATRKHVKVPRVVHTYPFKSHPMYGFGYDNSVSDDYKVVIKSDLVSSYSSVTKSTYVYSLKSNSWNKFEDVQHKFKFYKDYLGTFICGSIHWLVAKPKLHLESVSLTIAAFDLLTEKCTMVTLPYCPPLDEYVGKIMFNIVVSEWSRDHL